MSYVKSLFSGLINVLRPERKEITAIYFYALFGGIIQLSLPLGVQAIIGYVMGGSMVTSVVLLVLLVVLGVLLAGIMQVNQMKIIEKLQQRIFVQYSFRFAERLPAVNLEHTDGRYLPELTNRFFDTMTLQKGVSKILLDIPAATIQIFFGLLLLSVYHPLFILFGVLLLFILWLILRFTAAHGLKTSMKESSYKYAVAGWLEEMARVVRSFKYSQGTHLNIRKTDEKVCAYLKARTTHFKILLIQFNALLVFKVLITAAMLFAGTLLLVRQQLNIGQFIAIEIVVLTVIASVEKLIVRLDSVYDVLTSVKKLNEVAEAMPEHDGHFELPPAAEALKLEMQQVTFGYPGKKPVISDLSFQALPGERVCITGKNGSGKSTVLKLLSGNYTGFTGSILVNDLPLGSYRLRSLRSCSAVLTGEPEIFQGTLWENITMGRQHIKEAEVLELAGIIGLSAFIAAAKDGLNMPLGPGGNIIPSTICRKIILLRALVHQPRLLLLEEPWQGFAPEEKQQVQQLLLERCRNATLLVCTNDEAFIKQCDKIISL